MSVDHYENFPVASLMVPAALRPAVGEDPEVIALLAQKALES